MKSKKETLRKIIHNFEKGIINSDDAINQIYTETLIKVDKYRLQNYWRAETIDQFIDSITYDEYKDWESITDEIALKLLGEIIDNPGDDGILNTNSEALEKRYRKPTGTISDLIFNDGYKNKEILSQLKIDTVTYL